MLTSVARCRLGELHEGVAEGVWGVYVRLDSVWAASVAAIYYVCWHLTRRRVANGGEGSNNADVMHREVSRAIPLTYK